MPHLFPAHGIVLLKQVIPLSQNGSQIVKKIMPSAKISSFFVYKQKKAHIFVTQTRREKIGCETGSSKFQLLEKDY